MARAFAERGDFIRYMDPCPPGDRCGRLPAVGSASVAPCKSGPRPSRGMQTPRYFYLIDRSSKWPYHARNVATKDPRGKAIGSGFIFLNVTPFRVAANVTLYFGLLNHCLMLTIYRHILILEMDAS